MTHHYRLSFLILFSLLLSAFSQAQIFMGNDAVFTVSEGTVISEKPRDSTHSIQSSGRIYIAKNTVIHNIESLSNAEVIYIDTPIENRKKLKKDKSLALAEEKKPQKTSQKISTPKAKQNLQPADEDRYFSVNVFAAPAVPVSFHVYEAILLGNEKIFFSEKFTTDNSDFHTQEYLNFLLSNSLQIRPPPVLSFLL